ncbi:hypothetical protein AKO1_006385 [Acrasis kona]|uniref:Gamma-secretase-activating protein C-terminal domain-containing protein n=1 Tax=Acrasis kona TaxID=1008807 RepID=A0AAW2YLS5_9EUKA
MNLFVSSRDTSALDSVVDSIQETDLVHSTSRTAFTDAVTEYLLMTKEYKQQRNKAYKVAYEYTNVMVDILQDLFNLVKSSDVDMTCQFQKCEVLYSLCEETSFPIPKDFTDFFSGLGFKILPRNSFYQYIRRDVFKVTENLLNKVLGDSVASANESLMCLMFKKRKEKDIKTEMKYYEKLCFGLPVMIEHFHSIMKPGVCYFHETYPDELLEKYNRMVDRSSEMPYQRCDQVVNASKERSFVPLNLYLLSLLGDKDIDEWGDEPEFFVELLDGSTSTDHLGTVYFVKKVALECLSRSAPGFM